MELDARNKLVAQIDALSDFDLFQVLKVINSCFIDRGYLPSAPVNGNASYRKPDDTSYVPWKG